MTATLNFSLLLPTLRSGFGFGRFSIRYAQLVTFCLSPFAFCLLPFALPTYTDRIRFQLVIGHWILPFAICQLLRNSKIVNHHSAICFNVTDLSLRFEMTATLNFSLLLPTLRSGFGFGRFSIRYAQLVTFCLSPFAFCLLPFALPTYTDRIRFQLVIGHWILPFAICQLLRNSKIVNHHSAICFNVTDLSLRFEMTATLNFSLLLPTLRSGFGFGRFSIRYAQLVTFCLSPFAFCLLPFALPTYTDRIRFQLVIGHWILPFAICQLLRNSKIVNHHSAICFNVTDLSLRFEMTATLNFSLLLPTLRSGFGFGRFSIRYAQLVTFCLSPFAFFLARLYILCCNIAIDCRMAARSCSEIPSTFSAFLYSCSALSLLPSCR